ncbi:MAG: translation initiation factor IF-2 associated domain-containing protein, partial [Alteromonadaceae bacterium]|nr:translation initiation factor IF-2 associated domain-containing protein [Alteromonadaceae bacterium]
MADLKVQQLAGDEGATVDRVLKQVVEAGLKARGENDTVTSDEKQQLVAYLRKNHGEADAEPRKITLKRKTTTTLKAGKAKTVNVEVRKRRTYVKRAELQPEAAQETARPETPVQAESAQEPQAQEQKAPDVAAEQAAKPAEAPAAPEPTEKAPAPEPEKAPEEP